MKRLLVLAGLVAALAGVASAAEKLEDKAIGIAIDAPEAFMNAPEKFEGSDALGELKALWVPKDSADTGGLAVVHHMPCPDGGFDAFKSGIEARLRELFQGGFKLLRQEDVEVAELKGFMLDFECPGNGTRPKEEGTVKHRVRWYILRDGTEKIAGIIYSSREATWKDLEPKFAASLKTAKKIPK
jgi:hypothetical protein